MMARRIPPHGTENRYTNHGCRCPECKSASAEGRAERKRRAAYAEWNGRPALVDAEPVRQHIISLQQSGLSVAHIVNMSGVGYSVVRNILYGTHDQPPARRVFWDNAQAVLKVRADVDSMPGSARVDGAGTRRRIQALMTLGWTSQNIADLVGYTRVYVTALASRDRVTASAAKRIREAYGQLSMNVPADTPRARKAKAFAAGRGWLPPAAWDDDLIDLPDDELKVELRRQVALMDWSELQACHNSRARYGDRSPLTLEASREYKRRPRQKFEEAS
ncbi:hypothetical protein ACFXJ8_26240 [Nonomuraea sp. NPDC059194]|uniref:hypothetical protein n=1 Tax=Nonomuraea sp. NPDC059194 TaxID=3346764 RepID=UPI0036C6CB2E